MFDKITKEELNDLRNNKNLTIQQIANLYNVSYNTIHWMIVRLKVKKERFIPTKEILYNLYIIENKTSDEISEILKISATKVLHYLIQYNIELRPSASGKKSLRKQHICEFCQSNFVPYYTTKSIIRKFCSIKCSAMYNGLKSRLYKKRKLAEIRDTAGLKVWRGLIRRRDRNTCQMCGISSIEKSRLHCHHIKTFKDNIELRTNVCNGIILCNKCHYKTYKKEEEYEKILLEILSKQGWMDYSI
jgi:hypothetical protein